jgi:hypothetical protein
VEKGPVEGGGAHRAGDHGPFASQSESILAPATAWCTVPSAGLGVSAAWPVAARLRITGALDGYRTVLGRSYAGSGVPGAPLDPYPWQAMVVQGGQRVVSP